MLTQFVYMAAAAASTEEAAGGVNQLVKLTEQFGLKPAYLIAQIINFCVVAFILYRFAFKPVLATIDERQKKISDGLQYAEEMKSKLAEAEQKRAETLKEASLKATEIIHEARDQAKAFLDKQQREAAAKAEDMIVKAQQAIDQERQQMMVEVRQEVAQLVVQTTAKVLSKELSEADRNQFAQSASRELSEVSR